MAQRYRLPFTAVFGRCRLPLRGMFLGIEPSPVASPDSPPSPPIEGYEPPAGAGNAARQDRRGPRGSTAGYTTAMPPGQEPVAPETPPAATEPMADRAVAAGHPMFFIENGLVVFTAAYHLARGFCCGSGCRHCPYDPPHAAGSRKVR